MLDIRDHGGILGGAGSQASIKSIQRVSTSYYNRTSQDVAISSVDTSKTIVLMDLLIGSGNSGNPYFMPTVELTSSTNVRIASRNGDSGYGYTIDLYVIEFNNVKSKQAGTYTAPGSGPSSPLNISISSVNPSKCIAIAQSASSSSRQGYAGTSATVSSATNLRISFDIGPGNTGFIKWQVLEFK